MIFDFSIAAQVLGYGLGVISLSAFGAWASTELSLRYDSAGVGVISFLSWILLWVAILAGFAGQ